MCLTVVCVSVVAMVSMAFGIVGLIACLCCKDVDYKMTNKVCDMSIDTSLREAEMKANDLLRSKFTSRTLLSPTETRTIVGVCYLGKIVILDVSNGWIESCRSSAI